jgi:hypothetical protein
MFAMITRRTSTGFSRSGMAGSSGGIKYTRDVLAPVVADSASFQEVLRKLGVARTGGMSAHIARRIRALGLDVSHFTSLRPAPPPLRPLGRAELEAGLAAARSTTDLIRRLNLPPTVRARRHVLAGLEASGLDTGGLGGHRITFDPAEVSATAARCSSIADMMRAMKLPETSTNHRRLRRALDVHRIDTTHFRRTAWRKPSDRPVRAFDPDKVLKLAPDAPGRTPRERLHRAMIERGVEEYCALCGIGTAWRGRRMALEIDHVNGDYRDNRLENLRFLCPNCHATTETYCRKAGTRS